jgi:hypothetical protein
MERKQVETDNEKEVLAHYRKMKKFILLNILMELSSTVVLSATESLN